MTDTTNCIFCLIAAGDAPAERLYEDDTTVAFMDINPATDGHCLVIPRLHAETAARLRNAIGRA
jgi:histidine triad (HIT) family protein